MIRIEDKMSIEAVFLLRFWFKWLPERFQNKVAPYLAGYYRDQTGIMNRYLRETGNWKEHLDNCKNFIATALSKSFKKNKVAVLGSGWWLDLPVGLLTREFKQVDFYDVFHPQQVQYKAKKTDNLNLIKSDLTGGLIRQAVACQSIQGFLNTQESALVYPDFSEYDLVISLNILNQLDILIIDYLKKSFKISADVELNIRKRLQSDHLRLLPKGRTCLISDFEELIISPEKQIVKVESLLFTDLPESITTNHWVWNFDTQQTYNHQNNTRFNVKALIF